MKSKINKFLRVVLILILVTGCEDYLDPEVITYENYEQVTSSYNYTKQRLASVYSVIQPGFTRLDGAMLASASDEAEHTNEASDIQFLNTGSWNAYSNPDNVWAHYYRGIYKANQYIVSTDSVDLDQYKLDPEKQEVYQLYLKEIARWKSEARFLRAYFYFELIKRYGGVPIITVAGSIDQDFSLVNRNSLEECVRFVADECDACAAVLPERPATLEDLGRATKGAALALKSRILLYAASDLFNDPSWESGFSAPELISVSGDRQVRWQEAAVAAKAVIDLSPAARYKLTSNYSDLFGSENYRDSEVIFCDRAGNSNDFEIANFPVGYKLGNSGTTPSQNLVDAYEDRTGLPITDPGSVYDPGDPYSNRDPRLKATILTNNSTFFNRPVESFIGGLDGPPIAQATRTGYYLNKYVNQGLELETGQTSVHSWIILRLAEIYLNYAEALNEYDPGNADIEDYVNDVRNRAGMPDLTSGLSQDEMRERIRHERRIELAFEEHRNWDVRRWVIASDVLSSPLEGIQITRNPADSTFSYQNIIVENRVFRNEMYLYPIPQSEIAIAAGLMQNPGW
ncbi:MAG: RagB/SusD family nutrient uptake outer membrane protein [Bacteroidales bacterium]